MRVPRSDPGALAVTVEEQHSAFPKLMGAPAYARPPSAVEPSERPFDPDALPILAEQTPEERAILDTLYSSGASTRIDVAPWPAAAPGEPVSPPAARPFAPGRPIGGQGPVDIGSGGPPRALAARSFSLRDLTDRLRGQR